MKLPDFDLSPLYWPLKTGRELIIVFLQSAAILAVILLVLWLLTKVKA